MKNEKRRKERADVEECNVQKGEKTRWKENLRLNQIAIGWKCFQTWHKEKPRK